MNKAVVSLGSNIQPEVHTRAALDLLSLEFEVLACSSFVVTKPLGGVKQDDFLNGVVLLTTEHERSVFTIRLKELEVGLGRLQRPDKWGPREIDLDLLIWNGQVVNNDYYERDFLRKAVAEVLPGIKSRCY